MNFTKTQYSIMVKYNYSIVSTNKLYNKIKIKIKNLFLQVPHYFASIHKSKVHFKNSFSYDAPKLWNDLPHDIRSAPNLSCFKSRLKTYLFQKSFPP